MAEKIRGPKDDFPEVRDENGRILTPADFDRWETPPGTTFTISNSNGKKPKARSYLDARKEKDKHCDFCSPKKSEYKWV